MIMAHHQGSRSHRRASPSRWAHCRGDALATGCHFVLLLLVLGQIVYLASRHRIRFDTTSDDQYSLTDSTTRIVGGLDKRLLIEAYLSPKADLPSSLRDSRTVLDNFLDELVQVGRGKVAVQRFNPLDDKVIQDKCTRVGIKPIDARQSTTNALEVKRHWQGLRFVYGGGRQKVLEQMAPRTTFEAEALVTPAIKEVVTETRKKLGYMEWPAEPPPGQQGQQGIGWNVVRSFDLIAKRYEFQNVKDAEGALVPEDLDTLLLFRPKELTDRQKYVVDQFLMRGGNLVVFAECAEYGVAPRRQFQRIALLADAKDSQWKWQDQLLHYGVELSGKLVGDVMPDAWRVNPMAGHEYLGRPTQMGFAQQLQWYPYFFHPVHHDWKTAAEQLASLGGRKDPALAQHYAETLRPGIDSDEFLFQAWKRINRGPGLYWPTAVDLRRKNTVPDLPPGVDGRVLLWSSPRTLVEEPPQSLDPLGSGDPMQQNATYNGFVQKLKQRIDSETPRQAGLMLVLHGAFPSFFAGKDRPKKPAEIAEAEAKKKAAEAEAQAKKDAEDGAAADPAKQDPVAATVADPPKPIGPEPKAEPAADGGSQAAEPEQLTSARAPGRIVVVGDSDFVRDDFVRRDYLQLGGPVSVYGGNFFLLLVDWLSQDSDLVALQSRGPIDRKLELVKAQLDRAEDPRDVERRLEQKRTSLVWLNIVLPCFLLLSAGLLVWVVRNAQKRQFLESIGN